MARVLVVGSVAVDHVIQMAGAHLEGRKAGRRLGGGGANVAVPLARAGHAVELLAALGEDEDGAWLAGELARQGLDPGGLVQVPGASTRSLVLVDPSGERSVVNLNRCADVEVAARLAERSADVLYVRTRVTGIAPVLAAAVGRMRVVAHVPPCARGERPAHVLVGSASDLPRDFLRAPLPSGREVAGPVLEWLVVTRGPEGAQAFAETGRLDVPAVPVAPVDTTGAGDAFVAGLIHATACGEPMPAALGIAAAWGAAAASQHGSILSPESVLRLVGACA